MPGWLNLIPAWAWRWLAVAAVGAALFGYGYVRGYSAEERQFDLYRAQIDAIGKQAATRAAEMRQEQDKTTKEVRNAYSSDVARIRAHYERRLRLSAGSRPVPAAADCTGRPDGAASQPAAPRRDPALEQACALDAARVNAWRDFARQNGFPVK